MADGRYVRFEPKYDNANEIISAEHINTLQDTSERTQQGIFRSGDRDFLDKALFVLEHHRLLNGMWLDLFENTFKIDLPRTTNLVFSETEQAVSFADGSTATEGWLFSKPYINPNASNMKQVMVIASGYIPNGTSVTVEITNNTADWFEVPLSSSELFEIPTEGNRLQLRARFSRTVEATESPRLDSWAILFRDPKNEVMLMPDGSEVVIAPTDPTNPGGDYGGIINIMHHQLMGIGPNDHHPQEHTHDGTDGSGLISHGSLIEVGPDDHHPKAHYHGEDGVPYVRLDSDVIGTLPLENLSYQLWTGKPGTTGLYFDSTIGDKLVYVKTPDDETYLFYDLVEDRLSHTITIVQGIAVWEQMIFGNFINGAGETTVVLQGTEKTHYDASDTKIVQEIQKVMAPAKPTGVIVTNPGVGGTLNISWNASTEFDLIGYNLYRTTNNGVTWTLANTTGLLSATNFVDVSLFNGSEYGYAVTAVDTTGYESDKSDISKGIPNIIDTTAPNPPTGTNVVRVLAGDLKVTWNPNTEPDLSSYEVYMSPSGTTGSFTLVQTIPAGTHEFTHNGLLVGAIYYYHIKAVDTSGNRSGESITASAVA